MSRAVAAVFITGVLAVTLPRTLAAADYVGAEVCKTCHEKEYQDWRASGHAAAFGRLSQVQQRDRVCRSCHTMEPLDTDVALAGVQCESCHGAGALYSPRYVMKDEVLAKLLGLDQITPETCVRCHTQDGPSVAGFDFAEKVKLVNHSSTVKAEPDATKKPRAAAPTGQE